MTTTGALVTAYDGVVCDLDGVVYRGVEAVPFAVEELERTRRGGRRVVYATNNASRPPAEVAQGLRTLGLLVADEDVVTSAQAGARAMVRLLDSAIDGEPAPRVLAVGGPGVGEALIHAGLTPVTSREAAQSTATVGVLQGYGPDVSWRDLAEAAYAVARGALWVATNDDLTLPTERGMAPGNGTLVAAVQQAAEKVPLVVGKPATPLYELSAEVLGTEPGRTLAIGDRLDTDIAGALAAGMDSLFVLGGVHRFADVAVAPPSLRPTYLGCDLRVLQEPYQHVVRLPVSGVGQRPGSTPGASGGRGRRKQRWGDQSGTPALAWAWQCGEAVLTVDAEGMPRLAHPGSLDQTLRAAVAASWAHLDRDGDSPGVPGTDAATELTSELTSDGRRLRDAGTAPHRAALQAWFERVAADAGGER